MVSWVCAPYGACLVLEAEIWGAYDGLWQAWELRPRKIILETDSMAAVQLLRGQLADKSSIAIVREVRRLLKMQWEPPDVSLTILHEDMSCNGRPRLVVM
ncbi:hypothetical protein Gorai_000604 [Gossypium raimondii]|uniref:RNase H type-1 domain-containing protein n=1 Tax=Gossypium raimondii TaxID=29730 RepID=A0A7J8PEB5_GOSRA|nr:hypothetical protein [Gossypium raimondii]